MTTPNSNEDVVRRSLAAWDDLDMDAIDELYADEFHLPGSDADGLEDLETAFRTWHRAFSGLTHTVEDVVADGDRVAVEYTVTGTHDGEFPGVEPTGVDIDIRGMAIYRVEDGRIVEQRAVEDLLDLYQQLDAVEPPTE